MIKENNMVSNLTKDEILERRTGALLLKKSLRKTVMKLRSVQGDDLKV